MTAADRDRWEARWQAREGPPGTPEPFLVAQAASLPPGPVLDLAAGDGRNALWLAARGVPVTALDIAPAALARLQAAAGQAGLAVATRLADLDDPAALDGLGPFAAAIAAIRYRPPAALWPRLAGRLRPGGMLLLCSFAVAQAERTRFRRDLCLDRAAIVAEMGPALQLIAWQELDRDGDRLAGSLWVRPQAAAAMAS